MSLYQEITTLSTPYLGPAAESFISKQCKLFLKIEPESLAKHHLKDLARWIEVGGVRFMDEARTKELSAKVARA
jgi:hypothetical protein